MTMLVPARQRRTGRQMAVAPGFTMDPYREMEEINNRFSQLIRSFFGDGQSMTRMGGWSAMTLPVDVEETDDAYVVDIDLPNVDPHNVTIEMRGEELRISGEFEQPERAGVMRQQNRRSGQFEYLIDLPSDVDPNRVDATYHNGVLTVTAGKAQGSQTRRIEIHEPQEQQQTSPGSQKQTSAREGQQARRTDR
jgi:HSP20 family protein